MRFNDLSNHNPENTLEVLRKQYDIIKTYHNDIPKLQKRTLQNMNRCKTYSGNGAHCHNDSSSQKIICFTPKFLKKRAGKMNFLGYRDENNDRIWRILTDTMALGEILTHEISHFTISGSHNKRFYARQHKLMNTFINAVISGELYQ